MDESISRILSDYYDLAANDYQKSIEVVFAPLAGALVEAANILYESNVLDLGCGTGVVNRALAGYAQSVVSMDFSWEMVRTAHRVGAAHVVNANVHHLPILANHFDRILSNFTFNHTSPSHAFAESYRVLANGGSLCFHEWGARDELSSLVSDTFVEYMVDEPTPELDRFRDQMVMELPWDELETTDDIVKLLEETGFFRVESETVTVDVSFASVGAFIDYKLAWPARKAELAAMTREVRQLCRTDLEENLMSFVQPDGKLVWSPEIYRFRAQKPT